MTYKQIHVWVRPDILDIIFLSFTHFTLLSVLCQFQNRRSRTRKQSVSTTRSLMVNRGMSLPSSSHDTDTEEDNTYPVNIYLCWLDSLTDSMFEVVHCVRFILIYLSE